jgi:hypothetical protein
VTLPVLLSALAALLALATAAATAVSWREAAAERDRLRTELADLSARLDGMGGVVDRAATQAEVASHLLVEKGIADEEDLEAMRRLVVDPEAEPGGERSSGETVH